MTSIANEATELLLLLPPHPVLEELAAKRCQEYQRAEPYPHICLDQFLPELVARSMLEAFPAPGALRWREYRSDDEKKLASASEAQIPPAIRNVLYALNSSTFLKFLEKLTGIEHLIADPHFIGGGMHQIVPGGKLTVHVDFNVHPQFRLDRRLNLLIYLNENWQEDYGGQFELWDPSGKACVKKILPVFNRCVIFSTTSTSYHGHPHPLTCPLDRTRKSVALYYYSNGRPEGESRPEHGTIFAAKSRDLSRKERLVRTARRIVREITPPILLRPFGR